MSTPVISIITPSYNRKDYLEKTIKSCLSQEGEFFIEYIIVDGLSSDGSVEIIKKYDQKLKEGTWPVACKGIKYHWISEKDKGQTNAINKGIIKSSGDIVAYINSDDTYMEGTFQIIIDFFNENRNVDIVYGDCNVIDSKGNITAKWRSKDFDIVSELCMNFIFQPTVFLKRKIIDLVGVFNESLHYCMDIDYWYRASKHASYAYIPEVLASFRIDQSSKTGQGREPFLIEWETVLEKFFEIHANDSIKLYKNMVFSHYNYHKGKYYEGNNIDMAKESFVKSIRFNPLSVKSVLSFIAMINLFISHNILRRMKIFFKLI